MAIPMTRLGDRAFNHSPSNDAEAEYDRLRDLARQEAAKKSSCFDRAHQAYERGDGAAAKALSDEGKRHAAQQDAYNKQASEFIFRENNAEGRVAGDTIDLHGQYVEEAEDILEARIRDAQARGQRHLHVIVGRGNHSSGHVQRIKPRVEQVCRQMGLDYATEANEGRMYIDLTGGKVSSPPPLPQQPSGYQGGYSSGHQQGYQQPHGPQHYGQQHHGQQHHQQQPEDEVEKLARKFLPKIVRELKACCVVM
ncbi:Smr domain protein [Coniochaeta hoffmannii]|uniref:Smr domain protein n=1 Tax=Coniochaeta hoffmannii TaxID=91930 RepID=A0AA38RK47_9PEZI|nr:Smr domain protein [Coniochaeta hoffmannii]